MSNFTISWSWTKSMYNFTIYFVQYIYFFEDHPPLGSMFKKNLEAPSVVDQWCPILYWTTEKALCLLFVGFWSCGQKVSYRDEIKIFYKATSDLFFPPSASTNTVQLQQSHRRHCSGPAAAHWTLTTSKKPFWNVTNVTKKWSLTIYIC